MHASSSCELIAHQVAGGTIVVQYRVVGRVIGVRQLDEYCKLSKGGEASFWITFDIAGWREKNKNYVPLQ